MEEKKDTRNILAHSVVPGIIPTGSSRGLSAMIVTVAGCNLRCKYCSRYAVSRTGENNMSFDDVKEALSRHPAIKRVFVTGGEPFLIYIFKNFLEYVKENGYEIIVETNGLRLIPNSYKGIHAISNVVIRPKMPYNRPSFYEDVKEHEKDSSIEYFDCYMNYAKSYEFRYEVGCEMDVEAVKSHVRKNGIPANKVWLASRQDVDMDTIETINKMLEPICIEMGWNLSK